MNEFITAEVLTTFAGLVTGTGIIVQVLKYLLDEYINDAIVRPIVFVTATILTFIFAGDISSLQGIVLTLLNSLLVTLAASGGYEYLSNPKADNK